MTTTRPPRPLLAALAALGLSACAGGLPEARPPEPVLRLCADASAPPAQAARFCAQALRSGALKPEEQAAAAINLGAALLDLGRPQEAEAAYARAIGTGERRALGHEGRAKAREAQGDMAGASADWAQAAALAPGDAFILKGRSAFRLRTGDAAGALADAEAALARAPEDVDLRINRALALAALGREAEAEREITAALSLAPEDPRLWAARARLRVGRDPEAALRDYDQAVSADPAWPVPRLERGRTLERLGRIAEAEEDFRRAWELGLRDPALAERIETMSR